MPTTGIREAVHQLVDESDPKILKAIKAMLEAYHGEKWSEQAIDELNSDIKASEEEYSQGEFYTHEEATKISDQWQHQKV